MNEMRNSLQCLAIAGNIVFVLWILYNGIDEGFKATPMQLVSYIGLWGLLALNSFLLYRR